MDELIQDAAACERCGRSLADNTPPGQCPACMMELALGMGAEADDLLGESGSGGALVFGDYDLEEQVGRGGMGVVYRARHRELGRVVALKMILAGNLADREAVERFQREAKAAAKLDHPNIVPVYEIGAFEGQYYFTMKLVEESQRVGGLALGDAAGIGARRRQREIASCLAKLARAVNYAHKRQVIHRDLKPSNILIDRDGEPFITDFGVAKILDDEAPLEKTIGQVVGSPGYMSPEQARGEEGISVATDIYGLGAILYELLADSPPFAGKNSPDTLRAICEEPAPAIRSGRLTVNRDLETIALKCLEKKPADRYSSAGRLAEDLERYLRGEPIHARPVGTASRLARLCRRKPVAASLVAALLVALTVGTVGVLWQWSRAESAKSSLAKKVTQLEWRAIDGLVSGGEHGRALAELARLMRDDPSHWRAAMFATSILYTNTFCIPTAASITEPDGSDFASFDIHANERWMATVSGNGVARIWDLAEGRQLAMLVSDVPVKSIDFHPRDQTVVTTDASGRVTIWNSDRKSAYTAGAISAEADFRRARFHPRTATVIAMGRGEVLGLTSDLSARSWAREIAGVRDFQFAPEGNRILASTRNALVVFDPDGGQPVVEIPLKKSQRQVEFLPPEGARVIGHDGFSGMTVWDSTSGAVLMEADWGPMGSHPDGIAQIAVSPREDEVALALTFRNRGVVWNLEANARDGDWLQHGAAVLGIDFEADGGRIATTSWDHTTRIWDRALRREVSQPVLLESRGFRVRFLGSPGRLLVAESSKVSQFSDLSQWRPLPHPEPPRYDDGPVFSAGMQLSPSSELIALNDEINRTVLKERRSGRELFAIPDTHAWSVIFDRDEQWLITVGARGKLWMVSIPDGQLMWDEPVDLGIKIRGCEPSPSNRLAAFGAADGTIIVSRLPGMEELVRMKHDAFVASVEFSEDETRLLTASSDRSVREWDIATGRELHRFEHDDKVIIARYLPGDVRIASCSYDGTARIWDTRTAGQIGATMRHRGEATFLAVSPDGKQIATCSRDGVARVWDAASGAPLTRPMQHARAVRTVEYFPDGRRLLTVSHDGSRVWDAATGDPLTVTFEQGAIESIGVVVGRELTINPDGSGWVVGTNAERCIYWDVPVPPTPVPAWFPDFLEAIAQQRADDHGTMETLTADRYLAVIERIPAADNGDDWYVNWVRRYLDRDDTP